MNTAWIKAHWYYVAGGLLGIFVLYELLKAGSASSASTSATDLSGGGTQIQALTSATALQDAQTNAQTTVAAYAAGVQNNQTVANLQLGEVQTAAQLDATNKQTQASVDIAGINANAGVESQAIITQGQVDQTQIQGATIDTLGAQATSVKMAQTTAVAKEVANLAQYSKHFGSDIQAIAPVIAEQTGQGSTAGSVKKPAGSTTAQNISAVSGGISAVLGGLFG